MIDYHLFSQIKDMQNRQNLTAAQIADELHLDPRTVGKYMQQEKYIARQEPERGSKLDPYKKEIMGLLEHRAYSAEQVFQAIRQAGYQGGRTIVKDYVAKVRPKAVKAFLSIQYDKGQCVQVDWGSYGTISTGSTNRKLSFLTMVLGWSRMLFVHFTVLERMEHFLEGLRLGFDFFGGVPRKVIIDNLKTGVLSHRRGMPALFHPRFVEMAQHYGFEPVACNPRSPHEKGMVEKAVSFIKGNFLNGHQYPTFSSLQAAGQAWLNSQANDRIHNATGKRPVELLAQEKPFLIPLPAIPYDTSVRERMRASTQFRLTLDTNRYSVPWQLAGQALDVKIHMDHLSIFHEGKLVARHARSYDRRRDFEDHDHVKDLLQRRAKACSDKLLVRFLSMAPCVEDYYRNLCHVRASAMTHVRKIMALEAIYGTQAIVRAIETALHFQAFSSDYILHLLDVATRQAPEPGPLHLTRPDDALNIDIQPPNLDHYNP